MIEHPGKVARRKVVEAAEADHAAADAALGVLRMRTDPEFRRRYGRYLRNEIEWVSVLQGQTHRQWYEALKQRNQETPT